MLIENCRDGFGSWWYHHDLSLSSSSSAAPRRTSQRFNLSLLATLGSIQMVLSSGTLEKALISTHGR